MQSIDLSGGNFSENTSRTNLRAASTCLTLDQGIGLQQEVTELSQTIAELRSMLHTRDFHVANVRRDNERLVSELKRQQRCNRSLKQQLDDERFFYQREKEHFHEETRRANCTGSATRAQHPQRREAERFRERLENENKRLRDEILERSEVTYNLCIKFLRMKDARDSLGRTLDRLLQDHLQVMAEMMEKLDEAREELNIIVSEKFQDPLPISKAKFLQVVKRNSRLVYENSTLKLHVQQLTQNVEKLRSNAQKPKTISVDTHTIERLIECGRRRRGEEASRAATSFLSCSANFDKPLSVSKSTSPAISDNAKMISALKTKHRGKLTIADSRTEITSSELPTQRTRSAPVVVQSSIFRQATLSETATNSTEPRIL